MSYAPVPLSLSNLDASQLSAIGACAPQTAYQASIQTLPPRIGVKLSGQALHQDTYGLGSHGLCASEGGCNADSGASNTTSAMYQLNSPLPGLNAQYISKYSLPAPDAAMRALGDCAAKHAQANTCAQTPVGPLRVANNQAFLQTTKIPQITGVYDRTSEISLSGPLSQQLLDTSVMRLRPTATPTFGLAAISARQQVDAFNQAQFSEAGQLSCECEADDGMI